MILTASEKASKGDGPLYLKKGRKTLLLIVNERILNEGIDEGRSVKEI